MILQLKKSPKLSAKKTSKTKAKAKKTVTAKAPVKKNNIALNKDNTSAKSNIKEQSGSTDPRKIEVNIHYLISSASSNRFIHCSSGC